MNLTDYNARLIDDLTAELAQRPGPKPAPLPTATDWHVVEAIDLPSGWDLEVGYVWSRESVDDAPEVQVVEAALCTPARRVPLTVGDIGHDVSEYEAEIAEKIEVRKRREDEDRHPSGCRCRDCRDDIGDREMHARQDERGPRE